MHIKILSRTKLLNDWKEPFFLLRKKLFTVGVDEKIGWFVCKNANTHTYTHTHLVSCQRVREQQPEGRCPGGPWPQDPRGLVRRSSPSPSVAQVFRRLTKCKM